jgi:hypothetical protein
VQSIDAPQALKKKNRREAPPLLPNFTTSQLPNFPLLTGYWQLETGN